MGITDVPLKSKEEKIGLLLPHEFVDTDVVPNGFAGPRKAAVKANPGIQQSVSAFTFDLVVDT
jgi:hypothetical protein